jgi:hypothetical protein
MKISKAALIAGVSITPAEPARAALRQWIWLNLGFDVYDWDEGELRF